MSSEPVLASVDINESAASGCDLICADPKTRRLAELAKRVGGTDATVMITGESGTGKELVGSAINEFRSSVKPEDAEKSDDVPNDAETAEK